MKMKRIEPFSNDDGDDSQNVSIKMNSRFFRIILVKKNSQLVKFPGVDFLETALKLRKRKKNSRCVFTSSMKRVISKFHVLVVQ